MPFLRPDAQGDSRASVDDLHQRARRHPHHADGWYDLAVAMHESPGERTPAERRAIIDALARFLDLARRNDRRRPDAMVRFTEHVRQEARERVEMGDMNVPPS